MVQGSRSTEALDLSARRHCEHASTVHAAQGKAADRVLVHLDTKYEKTIGSESFYLAISRVRHEARLYVDNRSKVALAVGRSEQKQYALEHCAPVHHGIHEQRKRHIAFYVRRDGGDTSDSRNVPRLPHDTDREDSCGWPGLTRREVAVPSTATARPSDRPAARTPTALIEPSRIGIPTVSRVAGGLNAGVGLACGGWGSARETCLGAVNCGAVR